MPLPAVLSLAVDSTVVPAKGGTETCMPRVSPRVLWARGRGWCMEFV